jgi:hypothetical protein
MQRAAGSVHEFVFDEQPCQERPCPVACHAGTLVRSLCRPLRPRHVFALVTMIRSTMCTSLPPRSSQPTRVSAANAVAGGTSAMC